MTCKICNISDDKTRIIKTDAGTYCRKHYLQIYRHGKVFNRTIYDKNQFVTEGLITKIYLYDKDGKIVGYALIDTEDAERCSKHKWYLTKAPHTCYVRTSISCEKVTLHSFIMNSTTKQFIDHIDGDGTNNTKANLRLCSNKENSRNRHSSVIQGVRFDEHRNKWCASITINYKRKFLGRFDKYEDAIEKRLEAERQYFGEFAPQDHQKLQQQ